MSTIGLTFEHDGKLGRITIDNPTRRNAMTAQMWAELPDFLREAKGARVLLIEGTGQHFCAGADIHEMGKLCGDPAATTAFREQMQQALRALCEFAAPTIASIRGTCYGAGLAIAMACDLRFATKDAKFSVPPAKLGLLYPKEDIARLVALVGPAKAKQVLFTGEVIPAKTAARSGLINQVQNEEQTKALVEAIMGNSANSIALLKQLVDGNLADPDRAFEQCFDQNDFAEGLAAFAAHRAPDYS
ncbi:MAG: enoyl-CoA hydratase [Robiginitomaculum sp.]|nr:MAG: enoyl-CoA hydratase [Robiginitomaculum sp.]